MIRKKFLTKYQVFKRIRSRFDLTAIEKMKILEGYDNMKFLWEI
jgi:hypothetical protein